MRTKSLVAVVLAVAGSAVVGGFFGTSALGSQDRVPEHYKTFTAALATIQSQYAEEVESDRLVYGAINGMLQTLDPHSSFMDPKSYAQMRERQEGRYYGLGVTIQAPNGDITAVRVFEGSPAHDKGIRRGDVIAEIEGQTTKGWTTDDAVAKLRGPKGTVVNIGIRRKGLEQLIPVAVNRDQVSIPSLSAVFMIDRETGYVGVTDFAEHTDEDLGTALESLTKKGMKRLVLDLRSNPGGQLDQAIRITNRFVPKGAMVVYTRGRVPNSDQDYRATDTPEYTSIPMITLVNRSSASASEIVSGALQDYDRSLIIGETTFGKALVQSVYRVSGGAGLALTTARYYTPSGRLIQRPWDGTFDEYLTYTMKDQIAAHLLGRSVEVHDRWPQGLLGRRHRARRALRRAARRIQPDAVRTVDLQPRPVRVLRRAVLLRGRHAPWHQGDRRSSTSRRASRSTRRWSRTSRRSSSARTPRWKTTRGPRTSSSSRR